MSLATLIKWDITEIKEMLRNNNNSRKKVQGETKDYNDQI